MAQIYSGQTDLQHRRVTVYQSPRLIVEFELDLDGIAQIAMSPPMRAAVREVATLRALPYAISISPRGRTREYVTSWRVNDVSMVIAGMRRVAAKLINISGHAAAVEFAGHNPHAPGYGVLRRTLAHLNGTTTVGSVNHASGRTTSRPFNAEQHPRGARGRFIPKATAERLKQQAKRKK